MINPYFFLKFSQSRLLLALLCLVLGLNRVTAAARVASVSGVWSSTATWGGSAVPTSSDDVTINDAIAVSVDVVAACNTLSSVNTGSLTISGTNSLAVTGLINILRPGTNATNFTIAVGAGALTAGSLTMNATTTTRNNILTISTGSVVISGTTTTGTTGCQFTFTDAGTLELNGTFTSTPTLTTFTGSTVKYKKAGAQTVLPVTYSNLTLGGSGSKTTTSVTVNGILSMEGTATASVIPTYGTAATLQYNTTTSRTVSASTEWPTPFAATGGVIIASTGTITLDAAKILNPLVPLTINSGATLATNNFQLTLGGDFLNSGTFTAGTGTVTMNGAAQTIGGTATTTFYNLDISNVDGSILGHDEIVSNTLTLTGGHLALGAYNLTMGASANAIAGTLSATNMVVINGIGQLRKLYTGNGSYVFPVGDETGTTEYSPLTLNFVSGTYAGGAYASVFVTDAKHPDNADTNNYLTRYWTVGQSGITAFSATVTPSFPTADVVGDVANMITGRLNGVLPFTKSGVVSASSLTVSGLASLGDFTGVTNLVSTSATALTGFIYTFGAGPSTQQSFVVNGNNLTADITVTPSANFEISTTSGSGFVSTPITLTQTAGTVASTTIYIRLKAGLAVGAYATEYTTLASTGANTVNVACSNAIVNTPTIISSVSTLPACSYVVAAGPSSEQSFTVNGTSLTADISIAPPSDFEISTTTGGAFSATNPIVLTQTGGVVSATTIYVRMKSAIAVSVVASQNIVLTSAGATNVNVACSGTVVPSITAGGGGNYCAGSTINLTSSGSGYTNQYWKGPDNYYSLSANPSRATSTTAMSGTYTVTGSTLVGANLLTNGDFEGSTTIAGSSYTKYVGPGDMSEGKYAVVASGSVVHSGFSNGGDHTSGSGNQMVINAANVPNVVVWSETVSITANTDYQFTYWVRSVHITAPSQLQLYINGAAAAPVFTAVADLVTWSQFTYNWNSGAATTAVVSLVNQNTAASGNDFAIDDINFQKVLTSSSSVDVTVNTSLAVSVSIAASANPIYTGTSVTFTATPTAGGTAPSYQWKVDGVNVGTNSTTYTNAALTNGQVVTCVLTSNYPCISGGNPATSNTITMVVNAHTNFWKGTTNTDWGTATNWTAGTVPLTTEDVEFATVANNGSVAVNDLYLDVDRTIGTLINATTQRLVIPAGKSLTVNNAITTDGNVDRIYIASSSSGPSGSLIFTQPTLNTSVKATVEFYSKASWDLGQAAGSKYRWQFFGIPFKTLTIGSLFDGAYVRQLVETGTTTSNHWSSLNSASTLVSFRGYEVVQSAAKTYVLSGTLETADYSSGQLAYTSSALYPGQHLLANPYTAGITISALTFGSQTESAVYLYNAGTFNEWTSNSGGTTSTGTSTTAGQYLVSTPSTAGANGVPNEIPSMQSFLVKALGSTSNATMGITYSAVKTKNTTQQRAKATTDKVSLLIEVAGTRFTDKVWIFADPNCSAGFDNGWDGRKFSGSVYTPQLYAMESDDIYQIDAVNDMNNVYLGFQAGEDTQYTMTFTPENIMNQVSGLYLLDILENQTTDISTPGTNYSFTTTKPVSLEKRFQIVTSPLVVTTPDVVTDLKLFSAGNEFFVDNCSNRVGTLSVYTLVGKQVYREHFDAKGVYHFSKKLPAGAYIFVAETNQQKVSKKLMVSEK